MTSASHTPTLSLGRLVIGMSLACISLAAAAADTKVEITKFTYAAKDITVAPGTTVHWSNLDEVPHTVTSRDEKKTFNSKAMDTNDQYQYTFTTEGDFPYYCTVHPFMTGTVHVRKP